SSPTSGWYPRWQVLGAAWSTDPLLQQWTRLPNPVWAPCPEAGLPGVNWALCNPTQFARAADFRDPFVLPPRPGSNDSWLLYYTARPRTDQYNYVAGVAQASGPRGPWADLGALWDTYYPSLNSKIESPHVFRRGNQWHLLFTGDDGTTGIAWHTSTGSPVGPWTNRPSLNVFLKDAKDHPYEFALEPEAWFGSEHFTEVTPSGTAEYLAVVHSYDAPAIYNAPAPATPEDISIVEFRRMEWDPEGFGFILDGPNPVRSLAIDDAQVQPGQEVELTFFCEGGTGRFADLAATILVDGQTIEVDPTDLGLPARVALEDPQARVPWTVGMGGFQPPFRVTLSVASQPLRAGLTLEVEGGQTTDVGPIVRGAPGEAQLRLAVRGANAFSAAAGEVLVLELELPAAGAARVDLYDVGGRLVRGLLDDTAPAGVSTVRWDGRDDGGRPVPGGLYFARLSTALGSRSARLIAL
ncbi:MAG: FlgD immunoglobulin-like domain containing protein, partial [Candidatus Eisenbacteria bacterium]